MNHCPVQLSSERLPPATDRNRCKDPQPDLGGPRGILLERVRKDYGNQKDQGNDKKTHKIN